MPEPQAFEIMNYLGAIRDRIAILILIPAVAVAVVLALVLSGPRDFRATAVVAAFSLVSGEDAQFGGQNGARSFVDTLVSVVQSDAIVPKVAERTRIDARKIAKGLKASSLGTTGLARVSYTTRNRPEAADVVRAAAEETLRLIFKADVSQRLAEEAAASVSRVGAEIDKLLAENGMQLADVDVDVARQQIATLENDAVSASARADAAGAARFTSAANAKREQLRARAAALRSYDALDLEQRQAEDRLARARSAVDQANAKVSASTNSNVISVHRTRRVSPIEEALRRGGLALGIAAFLSAGIIVLAEMVQMRTASRRRGPDHYRRRSSSPLRA